MLSRMHTRAGMEDPADDPEVRAVLAQQASVKLEPDDRDIPAFTLRCLRAVRQTAHRPRPRGKSGHETAGAAERRGLVDIALISVMRDTFLGNQGAEELRWKDVEFLPDGTARITLTNHDLAESLENKQVNLQEPEGGTGADEPTVRKRAWPVTHTGEAATQDLRAIRPEGYEPDDRVFGISGIAIRARLKAAALHAGLGTRFTAQSPRMGMVLDLIISGFDPKDRMHTSDNPEQNRKQLADYYQSPAAQQPPLPTP